MTIIDAGLQFNSGHDVRIGAPRDIVLHHAVSNGSVQNIHAGHKNRGWIGIGYHFYVRKDGSVYRGRPENWIGAHAVGHNTGIGICAEGNFMNDTMGDAQKKSIIEVIAYLLDKYGDLTIQRHKDVDATACPGANYPFNEIVAAARNATGGNVVEEKYPLKRFVKDIQRVTGSAVDGVPGNETVSNTPTLNTSAGLDNHIVVYLVQKRLDSLGYDVGATDGIYGSQTKAAVEKYQSDNDCVADGEITAKMKTWRKLLGME